MVIGHLGKAPEMRFTPNGTSVANSSIACDRAWKTADGQKHTETEWFNVVAWGSQAEIAKEYLEKSSLVYFAGRLQPRTWQDKEDQNQPSFEIVARDLHMLNSLPLQDQMDDQEEIYDYLF